MQSKRIIHPYMCASAQTKKRQGVKFVSPGSKGENLAGVSAVELRGIMNLAELEGAEG